MTTQINPPKKVRLACQRCRTRRIKCDGQVPACSNCSKAGEVCLDVDSQNSSLLVPRNFVGAAQARIQWLESIIRERLPDVDLSAGPGIDAVPDPKGPVEVSTSVAARTLSETNPSPAASVRPGKRRADSDVTQFAQDVFPEQAHSIALNLGLLSLNSESNQKHYLGSSSGRLFANLIAVSPSSHGSAPSGGAFEDADLGDWSATVAANDGIQRRYHGLHQILRQELPRKQDAFALLQHYIRWTHPDFPSLDPSSLFGALEALCSTFDCSLEHDSFYLGWPSSTRPFRWNGRLVDVGNPAGEEVSMPVVAFIMFMVFNITALSKVRARNYEQSPDKFYRAALQFSQDCFSQISLPSIQALITLIVHSMLTPAEVNLWTLLHVALAHCIELGIHRDCGQDDSLQDPYEATHQQIRRYIFYTIYSLDRSVASIQGRPLGFRDETFDVKIPEQPPAVPGENAFAMNPGFSAAVLRFSTCQFELDRITSDIKLHLYHLPGATTSFVLQDNPLSHQARIKTSLERWKDRIPAADEGDFPGVERRLRLIWQSKLKARYHTAMVLLYQPSQAIRNPGPDQLLACFQHALSILDHYQLLHEMRGLNYGWRAVHNIFAAGATVVYCFWISSFVRQHAVVVDLTKGLRNCTNLLTLGGEWWPSAKRAQSNFGSVVDLTIQRLFSDQGPSKMPRLAGSVSRRIHSENDSDTGLTSTLPGNFITNNDINPADTTNWHQDQSFQTAEQWSEPAEASAVQTEMMPEVETFLADFDRADFSWSFPLDDQSGFDSSLLPDSLY